MTKKINGYKFWRLKMNMNTANATSISSTQSTDTWGEFPTIFLDTESCSLGIEAVLYEKPNFQEHLFLIMNFARS